MTAAAGRQDSVTQAAAGPPEHRHEYACARAWTVLTAAHAKVADRLGADLASSCGMGINDFEILLLLQRVPLPGTRLGDLHSAVRLTQPSLSRAVARLERRGWLSRAGAADDRRGVLVTISPAGQDVLRRAAPVHARAIREILLDRLTPDEQELLARALSRVAGE